MMFKMSGVKYPAGYDPNSGQPMSHQQAAEMSNQMVKDANKQFTTGFTGLLVKAVAPGAGQMLANAQQRTQGYVDAGRDPWTFLKTAGPQQAQQCPSALMTIKGWVDADPNYLNVHCAQFVEVLTIWVKKYNLDGGMMDPWVGNVTLLSTMFNMHTAYVTSETWTALTPCLLAVMSKKAAPAHVRQAIGSMFHVIKMQKQQALIPVSAMLLNTLFQQRLEDLVCVVRSLYPHQQHLVLKNLPTLVDFADRSTLLQGPMYAVEALEGIAMDRPDSLLPYLDKFIPLLYNTMGMTAVTMTNILRFMAARDPYKMAPKVNDLKMAYVSYTSHSVEMFRTNVIKIYGLIGRTSQPKADECMRVLRDILLNENQSNDVPVAVLVEMKNIGGVFKSVLEGYREPVKMALQSPFEGVRAAAATILDYLDNKALVSLPTALAIQDAKIEQTAAAIGALHLKQDEHGRSIDTIGTNVSNLGRTVEGQQVQLVDMERRIAELKMAHEYVDRRISEMKTFIASFSKKLPVPKNYSKDGVVVKTIRIEFECSSQRDFHCLHSKGAPFVTKTHEWSKWVKLAITSVQLGLSVYNYEVVDALEGAYDLYNQLRDFEDKGFDAFCQEPFLTSQEQDVMINQLRDAKFFDVFKYDAQTANWMCFSCAKPAIGEAPAVSSSASSHSGGASSQPAAQRAPAGQNTVPGGKALAPVKHAFVRHHFHKFTWCVFCDKFIWGIGKQGYKCTKCKYRCHPECLQHVPDNCGQVDIRCHTEHHL